MISIAEQLAAYETNYISWRKTGYVWLPPLAGKNIAKTTKADILSLLKRSGPLCRLQIVEALPHVSYYGIQSALSKLVASGKVTRTGNRCSYIYDIAIS